MTTRSGLRVWSDKPFVTVFTLLGGSYVLLIVALVVGDVLFLYPAGRFSATRGVTDWTWYPAVLLVPFLPVADGADIHFAIVLSLVSCCLAALWSVVVAVPMGYVMSRFEFRGKSAVDAALDVPIVLPPLIIGLSLLILFRLPPGQWVEQWATRHLAGTLTYGVLPASVGASVALLLWSVLNRRDAWDHRAVRMLAVWGIPLFAVGAISTLLGLTWIGRDVRLWLQPHVGGITYAVPSVILAQFSVACAFSVRTMRVAFDQINPRLERVALTLGASRSQAFWRVVLPQAWPGVLTAFTLAWARSLGEFGPILVFSGATRQRTEVLSTTVFLELSIGNIETAVAVSLLMIAVAVIVLVFIRRLVGPVSARQVL